MTREWTSLDINLAAYLSFRGLRVDLKNLHGRIVFVAPASDELYTLVDAYNQNDLIPVADYVASLRTLRAKMYSLREERR